MSNAVAIVGLSLRVPGASTPDAFWRNLVNGVESIRRFSRDELLAAGVSASVVDDPRRLVAHGALDDIAGFDANYFDYSPAEAASIDPQQRLFLECAHEALEHAGLVPTADGPVIGVFGGVGFPAYLLRNVAGAIDPADSGAVYQTILGNDKDFVAARTAYKLGVRGPAVTVQAACATGLVAVHVACQSVLAGECDAAIAGGASLRVPPIDAPLFVEGGIYARDGYCRAFDAAAAGTVGGSGAALVVLKRLDDAIRDRDTIHAVILGTAVTNDGAAKQSFTAPGVDGQAAAIAEARAVAGVDPRSIGFAEMHGTGTPLGDPIEIAAMRQAMGAAWTNDWRCYIGSVKTNIGHLDAAAGTAGLIKAVLALQHARVPPSLHFETPNPQIDFASGPLRVATTATDWPPAHEPRRASVSAFGLGGSNCHAVLEAAPVPDVPPTQVKTTYTIPISAQTERGLSLVRQSLVAFLRAHADLNFADVARTLTHGRQRHAVVAWYDADDCASLAAVLAQGAGTAAAQPRTMIPRDAGRSIPLPTYPFERTRHWIEPRQTSASSPPAQTVAAAETTKDPQVFVPSWRRAGVVTPHSRDAAERWLVIGTSGPDDHGTAWRDRMAVALRHHGAMANTSTSDLTKATLASITHIVMRCHSVLEAAGVLRTLDAHARDVRMVVAVTEGAADVTGSDALTPMQAAVSAFVRTAALESPQRSTHTLDVDHLADADACVAAISAAQHRGLRVAAVRHGYVWTPRLEAAHCQVAHEWRRDPVVLITGGSGALGITIAEALVRRGPAAVALAARTWPPADRARAARVAALQASGAAVTTHPVDAADEGALRAVVGQLLERHGRLDLIIHAAGIAGGGALSRRSDDDIRDVLHAKIGGAAAIAGIVPSLPEPPAVAFFSSINAIVPVAGQAEYAAANAFLDLTAAALRRAGVAATAIDWDAWRGDGMASPARVPASLRADRMRDLADVGLEPDAACELLWAIVANAIDGHDESAQVVVTRRALPAAEAMPNGRTADDSPLASTGRDDVAEVVRRVWRELLGVPVVLDTDDFFDLGGHSLLATSLTFQIQQRLKCTLTVDDVFAHSDFRGMAALVASRAAGAMATETFEL